jgi:hypothetical protein
MIGSWIRSRLSGLSGIGVAAHLDDCVFCTRREQPAILSETPSLHAMPDTCPMRPGHVLVIAKAHL